MLAKISVIDYDYYGYSDYHGGYTEPFYDDIYRTYDGDYYFDFQPAANGPQRYSRSNSVGFGFKQIFPKLFEKIVSPKLYNLKFYCIQILRLKEKIDIK